MSKVVHFGPIYGRPFGASMALCDSTPSAPGSSRTMSRSLNTFTCQKCEQIIQDMVNAAEAAKNCFVTEIQP